MVSLAKLLLTKPSPLEIDGFKCSSSYCNTGERTLVLIQTDKTTCITALGSSVLQHYSTRHLKTSTFLPKEQIANHETFATDEETPSQVLVDQPGVREMFSTVQGSEASLAARSVTSCIQA